jgi:Zn-dependent protease
MHKPRRDMLYVSLAGPATNFLLMFAAALGARAAYRSIEPVNYIDQLPLGIRILFTFALVNLFLGLFNLLPIPPLDGSSLIERVLPGHWLPNWYRFRPYGFLLLFLLVFSTGVISEFLEPFERWLIQFVFT